MNRTKTWARLFKTFCVLVWFGLLSEPLSAQAWQRWTQRWTTIELNSYFPKAHTITTPGDFLPTPTRATIPGPYSFGLTEWDAFVRIQIKDGVPVFRDPPAVKPLFAQVMHQAILIEVTREDDPQLAFPLLDAVDFTKTQTLRLTVPDEQAIVSLVRLSSMPEGDVVLDLELFATETKRLGRLALPLVAKPAGLLSLSLVEEESKDPTSARVGVYTGPNDGACHWPRDSVPIPFFDRPCSARRVRDPTWPSTNLWAFYLAGAAQIPVRPGVQRVIVKKGNEYRLVDFSVEIGAGEMVHRRIELGRAFDRPAAGWYSADAHVHVGRTEADDLQLLQWAAAEDIHVTIACQMGDRKGLYFKQPYWQERGEARRGDFLIRPGQEDPRTIHLGHSLVINNAETIWNPERYLAYSEVFDTAREQGALCGFAHAGIAYQAERSLAMMIPLGKCHFLEIFNNGELNTSALYDWWNMGFRQAVVGGSDFPFGNLRAIGDSPFYVFVDGEFNYSNWQQGLKAGRCYVSNGPMLEFRINGRLPGGTLALKEPAEVTVELTARQNPTLDRIVQADLIWQGELVWTYRPAEAQHELQKTVSYRVAESGWFAFRVRGRHTVAHTGAIYCEVDGKRFWKKDGLLERLASSQAKLEEVEALIARGVIGDEALATVQRDVAEARRVLVDLQTAAKRE